MDWRWRSEPSSRRITEPKALQGIMERICEVEAYKAVMEDDIVFKKAEVGDFA